MFVPLVYFIFILKVLHFSKADDLRLNQKIIPSSYEIRIIPDLENGNFTG